MTDAQVGLCTIEFHLPEVTSLKAKRSILKSMLAKLHNTFNLSAAEVDANDKWQTAVIALAIVSNSNRHAQQVLQSAVDWIEAHYPEALIVKQRIEMI
jgi:uncharacterized protein YlxP (DUF503 family)